MIVAARQVEIYPSFGHFIVADALRAAVVLCAVTSVGMLLAFAIARWGEDKRSAAAFLLALIGAMVTFAGNSIVSLGYPPVWWLIITRLVVCAAVQLGCVWAISESKQGGIWGRWRRPTE